jgi:hypothetical protein
MSSLTAQTLREIEFSVYGQYPVRGIEYPPVNPTAVETGDEIEPPVSIETHPLSRMGQHLFKGGDQISFYDSTSKELVARVHIPSESDKWLLIFVKNPRYKEAPSTNLKYLIYPFNDSRRNLPKNGLVFLNISGKELDGLLENRRVKLSIGESGSYRVQESLPINLWTRDFSGEKLLPALIKTYQFKPNHRYLMIFFPPVLRGSVELDVRILSEAVN